MGRHHSTFKQNTPQSPVEEPIRCIMCGDVVPFARLNRKYCRDIACRRLFLKLKKITAKTLWKLSDEEREVYDSLVKRKLIEKFIV